MNIDLLVDLNSEDETGLQWTYLDQAPYIRGSSSRVGLLVVGAGAAVAVAEVVDVGADGLVHVRPLPGQVNAERLAAASRRT